MFTDKLRYTFIFTESWFPGATGLEFMDKNVPHPCTVVERDTERGVQFLEPRGGWAKEDRVFRVICPGVKVDAATAQDLEGELLSFFESRLDILKTSGRHL